MDALPAFDRIARTQNGVAGRSQLLEVVSAGCVDRAVKAGALVAMREGVYRAAGLPPDFAAELRAAMLVNGRFSLASHRAAASLWDVTWGDPPVLELTVVRSKSARTPGAVIHRPVRIDERDVAMRKGFRVTSPVRTVIDLGAVLDDDVLPKAVEAFLRSRRVGVSLLRWKCDDLDHPRRTGPRRVRAVLDDRALGDALADSPIEVHFAELCRSHGIPMPVFQFEVVVDGHTRRIDFAYPDRLLAIEIDGWEHHNLHASSAFEADHVRQNELTVLGWRFVRFTYHQVMRQPAYVAETVRQLLAAT